ncbi:hypothetical protein FQN52_004292 [Onygenales sp. PD_12]|nr:hypothetical protein FQN52_004292 [Onygenales sp. PD_12]KAK2791241.1 hypothetical protein FQN53_006082 [Emmonsiellopsis sp. PD_33]KAK2800319.1 hypothetical protein FQN51_006227 [Onygenales sp. PD_10]
MAVSRSIAVVAMSTRNPGVGPSVTAFIHEKLQPAAVKASITLDLVKLSDFNLPVFDESVIPAMVPAKASFSHSHSLKWSAEMKKHAGFVFVIPEYNFGMAGGTKNAIDYLMHEIKGKPALVVSYGVQGGISASEQMTHTLEGMGLKISKAKPQLGFRNGGQGPDLFETMKGTLPDTTKELWEKEKVEDVLKGFGEVIDVLNEKEDGNGDKDEPKA